MNSLLTDIWRCVNIAKDKGQLIEIHMTSATLHKLIGEGTSVFKNTVPMLGEYGYDLWDCPVVLDDGIVEDNFWIKVVG